MHKNQYSTKISLFEKGLIEFREYKQTMLNNKSGASEIIE